jgi:hypothetical protein
MALGGRPILIADASTDPDERRRAEAAGIEIVTSLDAAVERMQSSGDGEHGTSY